MLKVGARAGRNKGGGATLTGGRQWPLSIGDNPMTRVEYDGDNPLRLASEIDAALAKYGLGNDGRMCKAIHFFGGELRLIAECLRCAGPQKAAKQPPGSTHEVAPRTRGVATREEIEKYLKRLKRMQTAA
jgi:hypothetical protein